MSIVGHSDDKYITGTRLGTSAQRSWNSILAETWFHRAGRLRDIKPRETEIAILLDGQAKVRRRGDGRTQFCEATPGTIWLCPAGIEESNIRIFGDLNQVLHIYIPAEPFETTAMEEFDIDPSSAELRYEGGFRDEFIRQLGLVVHAEMSAPSPTSALRIETLSACLASHLLSQYASIRPNSPKLQSAPGALDSARLARVVDFVEANLGGDLKLAELADVACLSRHHFARAFKKATGKTPHHFILDRRLHFSKEQIRAGKVSLTEAAYNAGFSNQAHFSRVFKQRTGMTPGEYRRKN